MKHLVQFIVLTLFLGLAALPAHAAFTSLYIFGDGISTTTSNSPAGQYYYGLRYSNGRVWAEVLAQRLGLGANSITNVNWSNSTNNYSYYGQYSPNLAANLNNFKTPADAVTALFVVWVNNADFVNDMGKVYPSLDMVKWNNAINQSLSNHWQIITNLYYAKNARTLILPNAVDITEIPQYDLNPASDKSFIRQRVIDFNTAFAALLNQARASLPGITIYQPDFFSLLNNIVTNAAAYGLTNALASGQSIDALEDDSLKDKSLNGLGANYIFWNAVNPTAKLHEVMADVAQQIISPVSIGKLTPLNNGSNRLDVVNYPAGLAGFVDGTTNLAPPNWTSVANLTGTTTAQSILVNAPQLPAFGAGGAGGAGGSIDPTNPGTNSVSNTNMVFNAQFYRLRFPFSWTWP
jgi:phospholipase/lecithinase/hemolysin